VIRSPILALMLAPLAATVAFADTPEAAPSTGEPYELVRTLQTVQDGIANGDVAAYNGHLALIRQVGEKLLAADPGVWSKPQNGQAVVVYLLSGGAPQIVRKLPRERINVDEKLFDGALAYVEGRQDDARKFLKDVQPRLVPAAVGGQIALVQGALLAGSDAPLAIERLDDARLLLPGTLVEEAALRREVQLVGQAENFDKFEYLTQAYIRHYKSSVYAGDFWQRFASLLAGSNFVRDERRFSRIAALLDQIDGASRLKLYLVIAKGALVRGRIAIARLAGEQALPLSTDASGERERVHLVRGAARVLADEYDAGLAELQAVDRSKLPEREVPLLKAALQIALDVRKPISGSPAADDKPPPTPARLDLASSTATLARAQKQLEELERLTKDRRR
jgi:chemotaxis protein MotC